MVDALRTRPKHCPFLAQGRKLVEGSGAGPYLEVDRTQFRGSNAALSRPSLTHSRHVASLPRVCAHRNIPGGGTPGVEDLLCAGQSRHNAALSDTRRIGFFAD